MPQSREFILAPNSPPPRAPVPMQHVAQDSREVRTDTTATTWLSACRHEPRFLGRILGEMNVATQLDRELSYPRHVAKKRVQVGIGGRHDYKMPRRTKTVADFGSPPLALLPRWPCLSYRSTS